MIANRAWQRWQLLDLLEEIQLRSSQEEQQAQNRCSLLSQSATVYTAETPSLLSNWTQKKNNNRDHYSIHLSVPSQLPLTKSNDTFNISLYTKWIFRCIWRLAITRAHIQSCARWKNIIKEKKYIKKIRYYDMASFLSKSSKAKLAVFSTPIWWRNFKPVMENEKSHCIAQTAL